MILVGTGLRAQVAGADKYKPQITLYADFVGGESKAVRSALESELKAIMSPFGLHFEWRDLEISAGESVEELVVLSFKADCRTPPKPLRRTEPHALGWTYTAEGVVLPFIDVCRDRVLNEIRSVVRGMPSDRQEYSLGRALARVVAHELYHVLTKTGRHSSAGAAKAFFTVEDLLSSDFEFGPRERSLLWIARASRSAPPQGAASFDATHTH